MAVDVAINIDCEHFGVKFLDQQKYIADYPQRNITIVLIYCYLKKRTGKIKSTR